MVERRENENSRHLTLSGRENDKDQLDNEFNRTYLQQLKSLERLLEETYSEDNSITFVKTLGNDVAALRSVPTALFCFLKAQNTVEGFCDTNPFQRTLELAMSFGGDADTIMSMAGALAGAYYGEKDIPNYLINLCEGIKDAQNQADEIYNLISS